MTSTPRCGRTALLAVVALLAAGLLLAAPAAAADAELRPTAAGPVTTQDAGSTTAPRPGEVLKGPLPGARTSRPLGLPVALAALGVLGVASLLVRVLLSEPGARTGGSA